MASKIPGFRPDQRLAYYGQTNRQGVRQDTLEIIEKEIEKLADGIGKSGLA
jgi:hypothetical protein